SHPKAPTPEHDALYRWVVRGELHPPVPRLVVAFEQAKQAGNVGDLVQLIEQENLPRECIPTQWLAEPRVWEALLERMPMTAMIRNLATMTRVGLLSPMSRATQQVIERLRDPERLGRARIHPIAILAAMKTYA